MSTQSIADLDDPFKARSKPNASPQPLFDSIDDVATPKAAQEPRAAPGLSPDNELFTNKELILSVKLVADWLQRLVSYAEPIEKPKGQVSAPVKRGRYAQG